MNIVKSGEGTSSASGSGRMKKGAASVSESGTASRIRRGLPTNLVPPLQCDWMTKRTPWTKPLRGSLVMRVVGERLTRPSPSAEKAPFRELCRIVSRIREDQPARHSLLREARDRAEDINLRWLG
jgi:hypothetical protein